MNKDVALSKLIEIFPGREDIAFVVEQRTTLLGNQVDFDQAISELCGTGEGKLLINITNLKFPLSDI